MAEGDAELLDLYRDVLLDYYRSGSHKGKLPGAALVTTGANPLCGDEVELDIALDGDVLSAIRWSGHGCVISQSSTAMLAELLEGQTKQRAKALAGDFKRMMTEGLPAEALPEELSETAALEGVRKFPVRIKCALLAWNTLLEGLKPSGGAGTNEVKYKES